MAARIEADADELPPIPESSQFEVIAKFSGDISRIASDLQAEVEILSQGYAIITLDRSKIPELYAYPQIESLELPKNLYIASAYNLISSCINSLQERQRYNLTGKDVIIAIIDSGIDYTHPDFRNADGTTRLLSLWDQTETGTPPAGFSSGAEYSREQLDEALRSDDPFSVVPSRDTAGHGTAIAGIAAGNGRSSNLETTGVAPDANLLVVKIGTKGYQSFAKTTELMRAVHYVITRSRLLGQPVAINISFGMNEGSHQGDSLFETYLSQISTEWKTSVVIPTGNEGAAGHHYADQIASFQTKEIEFFTASGIEQFYLSFWKNFADSFSVELIFPSGASSGVIGIENQIKVVHLDNYTLTVIYGQPSHYSVQQEIYFSVKAEQGAILPGVWRLRVIAMNVVDGAFNIWLPTLEEVTDKTYFSNPTVSNTMTIPSTAQKVIKVAGYNDLIGSIAAFSGVGALNPVLPNPDLAAPAVGVLTTKAGGGYDAYTGTSLAAPFVTGSAALMMQWGIVNQYDPFLYGERLKAFLRLGAKRNDSTVYPNPTFGYGTLCLNNTLSYMQRYRWGGFSIWLQR
ncbi:MAG: S8 family peptidase [Oscillospiraceae bacterium]|nr:S8 family peptidase [Oscillospiraceae bacterium]